MEEDSEVGDLEAADWAAVGADSVEVDLVGAEVDSVEVGADSEGWVAVAALVVEDRTARVARSRHH